MPAGVAILNINGPIVSAPDVDTPWPYTTLYDVQQQLEQQAPYSSVYCTINSPGGNADEGFGIYDLLRALPVPVTTEAVGQCSSIASIIYLAGSVRRSHKNLNYTVHFPFGGCNGTAAEMQAYTDKLVALQQRLVTCYTTRGTVAPEVITPLLEADTALTAEQMLAFGFSTAIVEPVLALASFKPVATTAPAPSPTVTPAGSNPPATIPMAQPLAKPAGAKPAAPTAPRMSLAQAFSKFKAYAMGTDMLAMEHKTDSGETINVDHPVDRAPEAGDAATDAAGVALADGSYTLDTAAVLVVKDGKVESYTPAPVAAVVPAASTAPAATTDAAGPATLEEALQVIQAMKASTAQASTAKPVPAAQERRNAELQEVLNVMGSYITSGGAPIEANDTGNPTLVNRATPASASANANSQEAKQAALQNIRERRERNSQPRK